jgi:hypothetical protein
MNQPKIHVVDADTLNPDVSRFYPEISTQLAFSQKESLLFEADHLCQLALSKPVIVNLPAQVHLSIKEWMEKNYLLTNICLNHCKVQARS